MDAKLRKLRRQADSGSRLTQSQVECLTSELAAYQISHLAGEPPESLDIVDAQGRPTGVGAPRWLVHLLGLRHRVAQAMLKWASPGMGPVFLLQVRSWHKSDLPGRLDITVGGHLKAGQHPDAAILDEMYQEIGLAPGHLAGSLRKVAEYQVTSGRENSYFVDAEWRIVYTAQIPTEALDHIRFTDHEVAGLHLCPESEAADLLNQTILPIATGLRFSLPYLI
ncbi:MAG: NUDIX domain-containing protein [Phycisphaerae bacterium]|nr:NUDIX domain-containing protein [Phycisphaerae bacterium]